MEVSKCIQLSNLILDSPDDRYCEIYKITCLTTQQVYIGQAVSYLGHGRYRPYGRKDVLDVTYLKPSLPEEPITLLKQCDSLMQDK